MTSIESEPNENLDFDQRVGRNIMKFRGSMSQQSLAERMRSKDFKWSQATVWATEKGDRPVRLSEVIALSEVLDKPYDSFFLEEHDASETQRISETYHMLLRQRVIFRTALKDWISAKYGALAMAEIHGTDIDDLPKHTQKRLKSELHEIDVIGQQELITDIYKEAETILEIESEEAFDGYGVFDGYDE